MRKVSGVTKSSQPLLFGTPHPQASSAMEELRKARIKRKDSLHVVFDCTHLLKAEWFRQLYKESDILFEVPAGTWFWPASIFEPLIIGISFPSLNLGPHQKCSTSWAGDCAECGLKRNWTWGIFCANFFWSIREYAPCPWMWYGECYTLNPNVLFHVKT
jgi:hypothetical protein